jgi:N-acetylneuraminic acid mutarotase
VWTGTELLVAARPPMGEEAYPVAAAAYDPSTDTWRALPGTSGPEGNFEGTNKSVWTGAEMILWGIDNKAFSPKEDTWRKLPTPPMGGGGPALVVWTGTRMIGWGGGCCGDNVDDGAAYDPAKNSWTMLPSAPLTGRQSAQGVWTGREMIVMGGSAAEGPVLADGAAYNPSTRTWRKIASMPVPGRERPRRGTARRS